MISVIVPSRNRPEELRFALNSLGLARHGLEALVWLDEDDPKLDIYKEFFGIDPNIRLFIKERVGYKGSHLMLNFLAKQAKYDWILGFSDDTYFDNPDWFLKVSDFVKQFEPATAPVDINIWDPESNRYNLFVFVSRKFFDLLGHISLSYAADTWVNLVAKGANIIHGLSGINPKHRKYTDVNPLKDTTYYGVEKERNQIKYTHNPNHSPFKELIKEDIKKIVEYNMSIKPTQLRSMKNVLIYISPSGSFNNPRPDVANDAGALVKVQFENSRALGWKKEDILLFTNFEFQYGDLKAHVLKDVEFFDRKPQASKINAIIKLFENGLIQDKQLYWFHDIDAFQLQPIIEAEIDISDKEIALTDYGVRFRGGGGGEWSSRWNTASIFFRSDSKDIFDRIKEVMYKKRIDEEEALGFLTIEDPHIRKRVKKINNTYNFTGYNIRSCYKQSVKPLKVAHFHPMGGLRREGIENLLRFFKGENSINTPLITERLIKILKYHRIRDDRKLEINSSVVISIPTYKRPERILNVYNNAKNSSPLVSNVYFIVEKDDFASIDALKKYRLLYFINERSRGCAGAHNTAYLKTSEKYFFTGSDDFDFKSGWLEKSLEKMVGRIKVVGVNDLHTPDIIAQKYAIQFLIDRDYIKKSSGVFDEENVILSETYIHTWADREFFETAKLRDVFAFCPEAHVEHLHYAWNLSPKDETYAKQEGTWAHDRNLYLRRKPLWIEKVKNEQNR